MTKYISEITNFAIGEIGAREAFYRRQDVFYRGMLTAKEIIFYGNAVTVRPPLKYIVPVHNAIATARLLKYPETTTSEGVMLGTGAAIITDQEPRFDQSVPIKFIKDSTGQGMAFQSFVSGPLPGQLWRVFLNDQPLDYIRITEIYATDFFRFANATGNNYPGIIDLEDTYEIRRVEGFNTVNDDIQDVVRVEGGLLHIGNQETVLTDNTGAVTIQDAKYVGESATASQNKLIIAENTGDSIKFKFFFQVFDVSSNPPTFVDKETELVLPAYYGTECYWVRDSSRGIIFATNEGVFLGTIGEAGAGTNPQPILDTVIKITNARSSRTKAVLYRDYLIYVSSSGQEIFYIRFDRFQTNAIAAPLRGLSDIIPPDERIDALEVMLDPQSENLLLKTNKNRLFAARISAGQDNTIDALSFSRWFVDYETLGIIVLRSNTKSDTLIWSGSYKGKNLIAGTTLEPPPLYNEKETHPTPHLDFYNDINAFLISPRIATAVADLIDGSMYKIRLTANTEGFYNIDDRGDVLQFAVSGMDPLNPYIFEIPRGGIISDTEATAVLLAKPQGSPDVIQQAIGDIRPLVRSIKGLAAMCYFKNNGATVRVAGSTSGISLYDPNRSDNTLSWIAPMEIVRIGVEYVVDIITAPLGVSGQTVSKKAVSEVRVEHVGRIKPTFFVSVIDNQDVPDDAYGESPIDEFTGRGGAEYFYLHYSFSLRTTTSSSIMLRLRSPSVVPIYITNISITQNIGDL